MPIAVMIKTLNEERNIAACINSFPPGTPVVLFDSFSTDGTLDIAGKLGAKIVQRRWDDEATHLNWAAANIDFGCPWVLHFDADERMTPELWTQMTTRTAEATDVAAFEMRRKDMFMGTWIRHSSFYPCWFARLYQPGKIRWQRVINPVTIVDGPIGRLDGHFVHYPFSKGTGGWLARHIKYAEGEAAELLKSDLQPIQWTKLFSGGQDRRRELKRLFYRMPARPLLKFLVLYLLRRGFLDGRAGYHYARMQSVYEYMIHLRVLEEKRRAAGRPI